MNSDRNVNTAYRCVVSPENSAGEVRLGNKKYPVVLLDTSRNGFTVRVPKSIGDKIQSKKTCYLSFAGELWEVTCNGVYSETEKQLDIDFVRGRELTKIKQPRLGGAGVDLFSPQQDPTLLLGLLVGFLLACVCLPGIGDQLGTAPRVTKAVQGCWNIFENTVIP
jgi:hypothetical protein